MLNGCSAEEPDDNNETVNVTDEPAVVIEEPEIILYESAPLTGVRFAQDSNPALLGPALNVKIDNFPRARPQSGLNSADIVFVQRVESGLTRFLATWHSYTPEVIGPLRSIRPMDDDMAAPFGGIIAYSGGQQPFIDKLKATELVNVWEDSEVGKDTLFRKTGTGKPYEHTLYANAQLILEEYSEATATKAQFRYADLEAGQSPSVASGTDFASVSVNYKESVSLWQMGMASFDFDADGFAMPAAETSTLSALLRTQDGKMHTDEIDGSQIRTKNVVVLETELDFSFKDPKYGSVPETVMIDSGNGWVFSDGKFIKVIWSKDSMTAPIVLKDLAGNEVLLSPGPTWIELLDTYSATITITPDPDAAVAAE